MEKLKSKVALGNVKVSDPVPDTESMKHQRDLVSTSCDESTHIISTPKLYSKQAISQSNVEKWLASTSHNFVADYPESINSTASISTTTSSYHKRQESICLENGHLLKAYTESIRGKSKRGKCSVKKMCRNNSFYYCYTCFLKTSKAKCICLFCANDVNSHV